MRWGLIALIVLLHGCAPSSSRSAAGGAENRHSKQKGKMIQPVVYFEIPVRDLDRAERFYRGVFGFEFTRQTIDGNQMALFPAAEGVPGVTGALARGDSYVPSTSGTRVYFQTEDVDAALARVNALGGHTLYPKTAIGELGWVAEFADSEGNRVALHMRP